ncbi:MAG: type IV secretory system conjugative DNA transfer family protein [Pseudomonadota bacterium]
MGIWLNFTKFAAWQGLRLALDGGAYLLRGRSTTHGSAQWASTRKLAQAGVFTDDGLILGKAAGELIRYGDNEGHVLCFAPSGSGKGVGLVVPNLLTYPGSVIVTDVKGENVSITARARSRFGPVYRLDPRDPQNSHAFNPLHLIRVGTAHEADDAMLLASLIIEDEGGRDSHWAQKASEYLAALLLHVVHANGDAPELQTLTEANRLASLDPAQWEMLLDQMLASDHERVRTFAGQLLMADGSEESRNVLSNITKYTVAWADGGPLATLCRTSDFDVETFATRPQSLFVIVPQEKLRFYKPFLRVVVGAALVGLERFGQHFEVVGHKPLFVLDEMAALGRLSVLEDAIAYMRTHARAVLVFQDLGQLRRLYGASAQTFISNCRAHVAFGINDMPTAQVMADRLGRQTVKARSHAYAHDSAMVLRHRDSENISETGRYLLDPAEILNLPATTALITLPRDVGAPIKAERIDYRFERAFSGLWDGWRDGADARSHVSSHAQFAAYFATAARARPVRRRARQRQCKVLQRTPSTDALVRAFSGSNPAGFWLSAAVHAARVSRHVATCSHRRVLPRILHDLDGSTVAAAVRAVGPDGAVVAQSVSDAHRRHGVRAPSAVAAPIRRRGDGSHRPWQSSVRTARGSAVR